MCVYIYELGTCSDNLRPCIRKCRELMSAKSPHHLTLWLWVRESDARLAAQQKSCGTGQARLGTQSLAHTCVQPGFYIGTGQARLGTQSLAYICARLGLFVGTRQARLGTQSLVYIYVQDWAVATSLWIAQAILGCEASSHKVCRI